MITQDLGFSVVIFSLVSLFGLWVILFWLHRDFCVDHYRQQLFALRDELFDESHSGLLSFDHPAYGMLRATMNGFIRFGHNMNLVQVILFFFLTRSTETESFEERWKETTHSLSLDTLKRLDYYRNQMNLLTIKYLIMSSPLLVATVVPTLAFWLLARYWFRQTLSLFRSLLDIIDNAAMNEGRVAA